MKDAVHIVAYGESHQGYKIQSVYSTERDALHGAHALMDSLYGFDKVARMDREAVVMPGIGRVWSNKCDRVYMMIHQVQACET